MSLCLQFKRMLNRELSHFAESSKSGNQIAEYICSTYLGEYFFISSFLLLLLLLLFFFSQLNFHLTEISFSIFLTEVKCKECYIWSLEWWHRRRGNRFADLFRYPRDAVWRSFICAYTARAVFHFLMPSFVFVAVPAAHVSCLTWRFSFNASKYTDYVIYDKVINGGGCCCCLVGANVSVTSRGGYVTLLMAWHQRRVQGRESASLLCVCHVMRGRVQDVIV